MTIALKTMIRQLEACDPKCFVRFDFGYFHPTTVDSYRGYYDQLALGFSEDGAQPTVADLVSCLKSAIGKTYQGYKGGEYRMSESTPVWVANYGHCHNTAIRGVRDLRWIVIIHTEYSE